MLERKEMLEKRLAAARKASLSDVACQRVRSWLLSTDPKMMGQHEQETLIGGGMVALGLDPQETASQPEMLRVLAYQRVQSGIASELGHCLPNCDASNMRDGICKHTGRPCAHDEIAELVELFGQINRPKELSEA